MKKLLKTLAPLSLLVLMVACGDPYKDGLEEGKKLGYTEGYDVGYDDGNADGDEAGYARAKAYFESAGYNEGFADGKQVGISQGYANGYTVGKNETYQPAYNQGYSVGKADGKVEGYNLGYDDGYDDGFDDGYDDRYDPIYDQGYNAGYNDGYDDGDYDGYDLGYDDGYSDGYDIGYDDGFYDGSLSVKPSKKLVGFANIISLAHNDVFDYSKIPSPKATSRGIEVAGKVLLSETSLTNKDTLKRAAVVEQYLVVEMAKQVKGKFGLSAERSLKVAKAANHFRKQSTKRALTSEDTNAYASEIVGSDFREISKAYEASMKGDLAAFESVLDKAAEKNGTSPENISIILTKFFM